MGGGWQRGEQKAGHKICQTFLQVGRKSDAQDWNSGFFKNIQKSYREK